MNLIGQIQKVQSVSGQVAKGAGGGSTSIAMRVDAMRVDGGYIQYGMGSGMTWTNLIAVAELKGADGSQGPKGEPGAKGDPGEKGDTGAQGAKGDTGATGPAGPQGPAGAQGIQGVKGADGAPGAKGADGITPHIGDNGNWFIGETDTGKPSRGATGAKGDAGATGPVGPQGRTPVKGTDYWTAADKQEIVSDVLAALPDGTEVSY